MKSRSRAGRVVLLTSVLMLLGASASAQLVVGDGETLRIDAPNSFFDIRIDSGGLLIVNADVSVFDRVTVNAGGTLELNATLSADRMTVSGLVTHAFDSLTGLHLVIAGTLDVEDMGAISADALSEAGFDEFDQSGGSYGGPGGPWGECYGLVEEAGMTGSGGHLTRGGGAIRIEADYLIVRGRISADGESGVEDDCAEPGSAKGGGSGGGIRLEVGELGGLGRVSADGGDGNCDTEGLGGGGGGGGRIVVLYDSLGESDLLFSCRGGESVSGNEELAGGGGTLFMRPSRTNTDVAGTLLVDDSLMPYDPLVYTRLLTNLSVFESITVRGSLLMEGGQGMPAAILIVDRFVVDGRVVCSDLAPYEDLMLGSQVLVDGWLTIGSDVTTPFGEDWQINGSLEVLGDYALPVTPAMSGSDIRIENGTLTLPSFDGTRIRSGYVFIGGGLEVLDDAIRIPPDLTVVKWGRFGAVDDRIGSLRVDGRLETWPYVDQLDVTVDGTMTIGPTGRVAASVRYFQPVLPYNNWGGSHGGVGAMGPGPGASAGFAEEALTPGGNGDQTSGGGRVRIAASELRVEGEILANGETGRSDRCAEIDGARGGGAGGSVRIDVGLLVGPGRILANGGDGTCDEGDNRGGGGGGGRIAVTYDSLGDTIPTFEAFGGGGAVGLQERRGSAGTVYLRDNAEPLGTLTIDNGGEPSDLTTPHLSAPATSFDLVVRAPSRLEFVEPHTQSRGAIRLEDGGLVSSHPITLIRDGALIGRGTVEGDVVNDGILVANELPGRIAVDGDLACGPDGETYFELAGTEGGVDHGLLEVTGEARLGGRLFVSLRQDYEPVRGDSFTLMTCGSCSGSFDELILPDLGYFDPELDWVVLAERERLELLVVNTVEIHADGTGDYETIQAAIDGETEVALIELLPGTFTGPGNQDVVTDGDPVIIRSSTGDAADCVIDCGGATRAFTIAQPSPLILLQDFTITGGYADEGGGILVSDGAAPILDGLFFESNGADSGGGGLHLTLGARPEIVDCVFTTNASSSGGGGLHLTLGASVEMIDSIFKNNVSDSGGGGLHLVDAGGDLDGCTFAGNASDSGGGGLHLVSSEIDVSNVTIVGNTGAAGSAIGLTVGSSLTLARAILAYNEGSPAVVCEPGCSATLTCTDVYGNPDGDWTGCIADQYGVDGNIEADPQFCDLENGDFRLYSTSPCAGGNDAGCGGMGAWPVGCESQALQVGPETPGGIAGVLALMDDGDVLELRDGVYRGVGNTDLVLPARNITLRSASGRPDACVIDCADPAASEVRGLSVEGVAEGVVRGPTLSGLTIRGGAADRGGAVRCLPGSRLRLERCVLADNGATERGGALFAEGALVELSRCTLAGNAAPEGSGVYADAGSRLVLDRTIIAHGSGGEAVVLVDAPLAPPQCCDLFGNETGDWTGLLSGFETELDNLVADPLFCDVAAGNLRLDPASPCSAQQNSECGAIGALPSPCVTALDPDDGGGDETPPALALHLYEPWPNPFNPSTHLRFDLPYPQRVELAIYALDGSRVKLLAARALPAGTHDVIWTGRDDRGRAAASGVYFARLRTEQGVLVRKMALLK